MNWTENANKKVGGFSEILKAFPCTRRDVLRVTLRSGDQPGLNPPLGNQYNQGIGCIKR